MLIFSAVFLVRLGNLMQREFGRADATNQTPEVTTSDYVYVTRTKSRSTQGYMYMKRLRTLNSFSEKDRLWSKLIELLSTNTTFRFFLLFLTVPVQIRTWQWLEANDLFDCVAGISYKDSPIGIGVFFDQGLLLTSANPLEPYLKDSLNDIRVHAITGAYNESTAFEVICANTPYIVDRHKFLITMGKYGRHSPLHDLLVLNIKSKNDYQLAPEAQNAYERHAFSIQFAQPKDELPNTGYYVPGFGYIDKVHIKNMTKLEVEILDEKKYILDCHEYIPWDWGRFICLENFNTLEGVQSGAPLLHKNLIYGIASFSVNRVKGDKHIFVFTDVRDYVYNLHYCTTDNKYDKYTKWWSKYWNTTIPSERSNFPLYERYN